MTEEIIKEGFDKAFKKHFPDAIIIDGVNVSGCKYYNAVVNEEPYCNIDEEHLYTCGSDTNCYYKQLQRLKQENEELKKEIQSQKGLITVGGKQQYELTLAYDKCKTALEEIREIANDAKEGRFTTKSEDYTEGMHIIGCYILYKINEVLEPSN